MSNWTSVEDGFLKAFGFPHLLYEQSFCCSCSCLL